MAWYKIILKIALTATALVVTLALLTPIFFVILTSLSPVGVIAYDVRILGNLTLENYIDVISSPEFQSALANSVIVTFLTIVISILVITPAAYAFSRFKFKGRSTALYFYLMFSQIGGGFGIAALVALFVFLAQLERITGIPMIGNLYVLPFIYAAGMVPFNVWLLKSFFDTIPKELDEAAFMDGADWFNLLFKVILPSSKPGVIVLTLFAFMGGWSEFILANTLQVTTLPVQLYKYTTGLSIYWNKFSAFALIFAAPVVILYILSQKYIGEAMRLGVGKR